MLTGLGAILVLYGFRKKEDEESHDSRIQRIMFIGPIPLIFGGVGRRGMFVLVSILLLILMFLTLNIVLPRAMGLQIK
jgi:uncharacterized membrane protein